MSHHRLPANEERYRMNGRLSRSNPRHEYASSRDLFRRVPSEDDELRGKRPTITTYNYRSDSSRSLYRKAPAQQRGASDQDRPYPPPSWGLHLRRVEEPAAPVYRRQSSGRDLYDSYQRSPTPPKDYRRRIPLPQSDTDYNHQQRNNKPPLHSSERGRLQRKPSLSREDSFQHQRSSRAGASWNQHQLPDEGDDYQRAVKEQEVLLRRERAAAEQQPQYSFPYDPDFPSVQESEVSSSGGSSGFGGEDSMNWLSKSNNQHRSASSPAKPRLAEVEEPVPYMYRGGSRRHLMMDAPREVFVEEEPQLSENYGPTRPHKVASRRPESTVEVAPGEHMRLRGADETWRAIRNDFYVPCECICCSTTIFCIQDAQLVLCPNCRVVSPLENGSDDGGVGLGFRMEDLAKWQSELVEQISTPTDR